MNPFKIPLKYQFWEPRGRAFLQVVPLSDAEAMEQAKDAEIAKRDDEIFELHKRRALVIKQRELADLAWKDEQRMRREACAEIERLKKLVDEHESHEADARLAKIDAQAALAQRDALLREAREVVFGVSDEYFHKDASLTALLARIDAVV